MTLIARIEAAGPEDQASLLLDAAIEISNGSWGADKIMAFDWMLDAKAYESAALMLVPDEHRYLLDKRSRADRRQDGYRANVWQAPAVEYEATLSWARTPALAIAAAALKARAAKEGER